MTQTISKISTQKTKGRYNLELDGKFAFGVSEMTLIKFGLMKNRQLNEKDIIEIKKYEESAQAISKALTFLSHHLRTEKEVLQKLRGLDFSPSAIQSAIAHLKAEKYLDDRVYAENFVRTQANLSSLGPTVIDRKLRAVGVFQNDIDAALKDYPVDDQIENAFNLAEKFQKHYAKNSIIQQKQKINQALFAKGYHSDLIKQVVERLDFQVDEDQQLANVRAVTDKIWSRYEKYGRQRVYKARAYLYGKGFPAELIDRVIGEKDHG